MARPRKPTHLKVVAGTAQKSRTNAHEPKPPPGIPPAPKHLSARARTAWAQLAVIVNDMGVLTESDPIALEMLCNAYVDLLQARASLAQPLTLCRLLARGTERLPYLPGSPEWIAATAELVTLAEAGERYYWTIGKSGPMRRQRPEIADIADAERRVAMWLAKFGLTPADRSRVSAAPKTAENPFADLG